MMIPTGRIFRLLATAFLFLAVLSWTVPAGARTTGKQARDVRFRFAFGALHGNAKTLKIEPVTDGLVLRSGDKLKMMIELRRKCFVYVIHVNSQNEVSMIFPYDLRLFTQDYEAGRRYYVPQGEAWFQLDDNPGKETFYLIAADQRLQDVEFAYSRYMAAEPAKRLQLASMVISEIQSLQEQQRASSEEPELLARDEGAQRGFERATGADPTDVAPLAVNISFDNLYSKTIAIEHR
jgi:hypothetical protein